MALKEGCTLAELYHLIDAPDVSVEDVLTLFTLDLKWEFSLPDRAVGGDYDGFRSFFTARLEKGDPVAKHQVFAATRAGRIETLVGALQQPGQDESPFVVAAEIDASQRIRRLMMRRSADVDLSAGKDMPSE